MKQTEKSLTISTILYQTYWMLLYLFFILFFFFFSAPRHLVGNLPPYTNVSLKMILTNPEGRKESDETIIQTDEDGATNNRSKNI